MKREEWTEHFVKQKGSGLSVVSYCKREGLQRSGWYYWKRRLQSSRVDIQRSFVQAQLVESPVSSSCEFIFPSGVRLKVEELPSVLWIRSLVS